MINLDFSVITHLNFLFYVVASGASVDPDAGSTEVCCDDADCDGTSVIFAIIV